MPDPAPPPLPPVTSGRDALRIVLFGMPHAGKTSLLGALAQAAQTQEHLLNGHLTDPSQGLAELRQRLYEEKPRETAEEVVPYAVAFDPLATGENDRNHQDVVLVDCDGRAANELLSRRRPLSDAKEMGSLAGAVLAADALVLVIDAAAPPAQVDADFAEFGRFLHSLERNRGGQSEIGGLPVFLVLSKCDLLARPDDTATSWMDRVEERKGSVGKRFHEFLARHAATGLLPFGSIDLHLWATAIKRPSLADSPAKPREPYGVAELFRQALEFAGGFRARRARSGRRLIWTAAVTVGLLAVMMTTALALLLYRQDTRPTALAAKVEIYRLTQGNKTASERLRGPLPPKISELKEILNSPEFGQLTSEDQDFVRARLQELEDYADYRERLQRIRLGNVRNEADAREVENRLTNDLAPPPPYGKEWAQTEAVLHREQLLKDVRALRVAGAEAEEWYRRQSQRGQELRSFGMGKPADAPSWEDWLKRGDSLLGTAFPHLPTEELPGTANLTYAAVLNWAEVTEARKDWEGTQPRLERLRDLVAALGLAGRTPDGGRQPLDIPKPFSLEQVRQHYQKLEALYPRLVKEAAAVELPEAIAREIQHAARTSYEHLLEPAREAVLIHLRQVSPDGRETLEGWRQLRPWLADPPELREWRVLADLLTPFQGTKTADPITALSEFLAKDQFPLDIQRVTLTVPFERKLRPAGPLAIYHNSKDTPALIFKAQDEEGRRDPQQRVTVYTFDRASGAGITYRPGDTLFAKLPVRRDGDPADWALTWARNRSDVYQFERLVRPPRLHRKDQPNKEGELLENVIATVTPESGLPRVPDLMPVVILKKP